MAAAPGANRRKEHRMADVSIVYCKPCGYEKRAADAGAALRQQLNLTVRLVPGAGGIFEVQVGTEVVAKRSHGHFPDIPEIVAAVSAARAATR
jgi:selenoprotein W-related protein